MASNINYEDIDDSFPRTGVDNPSQGFRDNFSVIKDSFQTAKEEISTLQSTTAKINSDNDFNGNLIKQAKFVNCVQESFTRTTPSTADQIVDFNNGNYQEFRLDKNTNFILDGWPQSDGYASLRVALFSTTDVSHVATFRVNGAGTISYDQETTYTEVGQSGGQSIQVVTRGMSSSQLIGPDIKVYEFWTKTNGSLVYARYLGIYNPSAPSSAGNSALSTTSLSVTGTATIADTVTLSRSTGTSLDVKGDSVFEKDVVIEGNLVVQGTASASLTGVTVASIGAIGDVNVSNPGQGDTLRYDSNTQRWSNQGAANLIEYEVQIAGNGSQTQPVYYFRIKGAGEPGSLTALQTSDGEQITITFKNDTIYRFDTSHISNAGKTLRFSTTPDVVNPTSINPYTTGVSVIGISGTSGSYTQIKITSDTPSPLYFYAEEPPPPNNVDYSFYGAAYPISVNNGAVKVINKNYVSIGNQIIYVDTNEQKESITIKLPPTQKTSPGMFVTVTDSGAASVFNVIIQPPVGGSINGLNQNKIIDIDYYSVTLVTDGEGRWSINDAFVEGGTILKSTNSTSTTTGALQIRGGVGIFGNINMGGNLTVGALSQFSAVANPTAQGSPPTAIKDFDLNGSANSFLRSYYESIDNSWKPQNSEIPPDSPTQRIRINGILRQSNIVTMTFRNEIGGDPFPFTPSGPITFTRQNTGHLTVTGKTKISLGSKDESDNIDLNKSSFVSTLSNNESANLGIGEEGQIIFICKRGSGTLTVTVTNAAWTNGATGRMVLSYPGSSASMIYLGSQWFCVGSNGAQFGDNNASAAQCRITNSIGDLANVQLTSPTNGQVLKWNGTSWTNGVDAGATLTSLTDVSITNPTNDQVLKYNSSTGRWVNNADAV